MEVEFVIRVVMGAILAVGFGISGFYRRRATVADPSATRAEESAQLKLLRAFVALPAFGVLLGSLLIPRWFGWASFAAPDAVQYLGVAVAAAGVPLAAWLFPHLGNNVTATVLTKDSHRLVTSGPYRWVRHPLYLAGILLLGGAGLALSNWVVLAFVVVFLATWHTVVIPREEASLLERFGADYEAYRERTGALLPRC